MVRACELEVEVNKRTVVSTTTGDKSWFSWLMTMNVIAGRSERLVGKNDKISTERISLRDDGGIFE